MIFQILYLIFASLIMQVIDAQLLGNQHNLGLHGRPYQNQISNPGYAANSASIAAEKAALNVGYGNFANGMAMDPAFANIAGFNQELGSFNGGGLIVTSSSPIAASGVTVQSENLVVEGPLAVTGQLPFLGVVELEGPLPATGQGAVAYGAGNGNIGMIGENLNGTPEPSISNVAAVNSRNAGFGVQGVGRRGIY
ncbi:chorion class B protein PC10-like [Pieris brassicae]|uniref:chorion class B protein PC10-like n=1 Tax=Pieris brassicae TaxID=7116 RepID=UPI001E65FEA5|nr:chorion class B protein PC10-like [Pieris brassicae]